MMALVDPYGRHINYLRLSVADRCNLRCQYCMPAEGIPKLCHSDILSYEDLYRVAAESVMLGIKKIRITGGEPLVRRGLVDFIARLASIPGLDEIVLTTNGILLSEMAVPLRSAGLKRINVSLDSLKPDRFSAITRGGDLRRVIDGIAAAEQAGFPAVKLNMVVMRGINEDEVLDFAALTLHKPHTVRFIEYMPTAEDPEWNSRSIAGNEILARIAERYTLIPMQGEDMAGPARLFRIPGSAGAIGIITPISSHFCNGCNRIRVTASGLAKGCLFGKDGTDLKPSLARDDNEHLRDILRRMVTRKPLRHDLLKNQMGTARLAMSQIGG